MSWEFYTSGLGDPHAHWNTQAYRKVSGCMVDTSKFSSLYTIGPDRDGDLLCPIKVTPFIIQLLYGWVGRIGVSVSQTTETVNKILILGILVYLFIANVLKRLYWSGIWGEWTMNTIKINIYIYILPMIVETNIIANQKYRLQWSSILNWKLRMIWVTMNNRQKKLQQILNTLIYSKWNTSSVLINLFNFG